MIIWSIQDRPVVDIINSGKTYRCDGRKAVNLRIGNDWDRLFLPVYKWMVEQMKERGIQKDNRFPVWGWYKYKSSGKNKKAPTIKQLQRYDKGFFRLKLSFKQEEVLLTNFYDWEEFIIFSDFGFENNIHRETVIKNIFNIKNSTAIQACFPYIKQENVLKIEEI